MNYICSTRCQTNRMYAKAYRGTWHRVAIVLNMLILSIFFRSRFHSFSPLFFFFAFKGQASNQKRFWFKNQAIQSRIKPFDNIPIFTVQVHFMSRLCGTKPTIFITTIKRTSLFSCPICNKITIKFNGLKVQVIFNLIIFNSCFFFIEFLFHFMIRWKM